MSVKKISQSSLPISFTDVLIIGAGPSGLMAGQALARLGVKVRIIDRRHKGTQYGNADGILPRTLEVFKSYDMLDELLAGSNQLHCILMYKPGKNGIERLTPEVNYPVNTNYPFEATTSIEHIEGVLNSSMEKYGVYIEQPFAPTAISISDVDSLDAEHPIKVVLGPAPSKVIDESSVQDAVNSEIAGNPSISVDANRNESRYLGIASDVDGSEIIYAKYVIGADGARSWVRRSMNIELEGDQTEYAWGVLDASIETDFPDWRIKTIIETPVGSVVFIPREYNIVRIYMQLSASDLVTLPDGRLDKSRLDPEAAKLLILERVKAGLAPFTIEFREVIWFTVFLVAQRIASRFSEDNRIFIAGDACHTHSPKAGQGANASMADTHNLAWKLAYVIKGWAKPSLLETYETERKPSAEDLIYFDKKLSQILDLGSASTYIDLWRQSSAYFGGLSTRYQSALTSLQNQELAKDHLIGTRLPPSPIMRLADWWPMNVQDLVPSDGLFKLIIFPGDIQYPLNAERLSEFSESLFKSDGNGKDYATIMWIGTILGGNKEGTLWTNVPKRLKDRKRVFIDEVTSPRVKRGTVCDTYGIGPSGAALLVRPDGYTSLVAEVSSAGARRVAEFIDQL